MPYTLDGNNGKAQSAATINATVIKASPGKIHDIVLSNGAAAARWIKFYDKTTAPNPASDTPKFKLMIPVGGTITANFAVPIIFAVGIAYVITGAVGNTDTTATAVDDVNGTINWI